jgi:phosphopantothenoylcysteine decarboxylase/phosphopantothenate--cysteine ligase
MGLLSDKRILLGVSGGIAAYKTPELVRRLRDAGADVHVILTEAATRFVAPLALEVVSQHPVGLDMWTPLRAGDGSHIAHTELARDSDLVILAPATADLIGRIRHGLADDLLTTSVMAARTPVLVCPAMNSEMLENQIVASNIDALRGMARFHFLEPEAGLLACGVTGPGRLPDPPDIIDAAFSAMIPKSLVGLRITLTAGPTREFLDPVRYLGNPSTGTMGFELARALAARGAQVTIVTGPVEQRTPALISRRVDVTSAADMHTAVASLWPTTDVLIMSAAVADYRPKSSSPHKVKKSDEPASLELERTVDILSTMSGMADRDRVVLIGFAAETRDVLGYARDKLHRKRLDWIVGNDVSGSDIGFGRGENAGWLVSREAEIPLPRAGKSEFAEKIVLQILPHLQRHLGSLRHV